MKHPQSVNWKIYHRSISSIKSNVSFESYKCFRIKMAFSYILKMNLLEQKNKWQCSISFNNFRYFATFSGLSGGMREFHENWINCFRIFWDSTIMYSSIVDTMLQWKSSSQYWKFIQIQKQLKGHNNSRRMFQIEEKNNSKTLLCKVRQRDSLFFFFCFQEKIARNSITGKLLLCIYL